VYRGRIVTVTVTETEEHCLDSRLER
jgi:hypothetical protein